MFTLRNVTVTLSKKAILQRKDTLHNYRSCMIDYSNNITNPNFRQKSGGKLFNPPAYSANKFINDLNKEEEKRLNGGFGSKILGSPSAMYGSLGIILVGELACLKKIRSQKSNFPTRELKKTFRNKILLALGGVFAVGIAFGAVIQNWQNKIINKKSTKPQEFLEKYGSDTSAKLSDNNLRSLSIAAQYNSFNGVIEINKNYLNDPIGKKMVEKYIKHELQHARQFEMIAGLDNGLEKLNYVSIYPTIQFVKKNPLALAQFKDIIKDINNDKQGIYNNVKIPLNGAKVDLKKYIKIIEIMIDNPQATPKDIPIIIDEEHYKNALAKHGPLSEKEKIKAEEYYQAALKYPLMTGINLLNPFSGYRSNILEKEARKASKSKTGKIVS